MLVSLFVSTTVPIASDHSLPFPHSHLNSKFALRGETKTRNSLRLDKKSNRIAVVVDVTVAVVVVVRVAVGLV